MIIALYKNKGSNTDCGNYWTVSLLSIGGKILPYINLKQASFTHIQRKSSWVAMWPLLKSQYNWHNFHHMTDPRECIKQNINFHNVFIDLTKAFSAVNREVLWVIFGILACPEKCISIIHLMHNNMMGVMCYLMVNDQILLEFQVELNKDVYSHQCILISFSPQC